MSILRDCPAPLALALDGGVELAYADLFKFVLVDGVTTYYWTSYDQDLTVSGQLYSSKKPWLQMTKWNLVNTMQVPSMGVDLRALNDSFSGGAQVKQQIYSGLFDLAVCDYGQVFMEPGSVDTTIFGGEMAVFNGVCAAIDMQATKASITVAGKNNLLDQFFPRNVYQKTCLHAFCDSGCTLSRATFTTTYTLGSGGTRSFLPWSGSPPPNAALYALGTVAFTTGAAAGNRRTVAFGDSTGLTLVTPLTYLPSAGDQFTAFQGCDKSLDSGSGQSCTAYANTQNWRAFRFTPTPNAAF
jgi:uncharacterized phage protein (TIGR02218 family)